MPLPGRYGPLPCRRRNLRRCPSRHRFPAPCLFRCQLRPQLLVRGCHFPSAPACRSRLGDPAGSQQPSRPVRRPAEAAQAPQRAAEAEARALEPVRQALGAFRTGIGLSSDALPFALRARRWRFLAKTAAAATSSRSRRGDEDQARGHGLALQPHRFGGLGQADHADQNE